jgi:hypothetical protein
LYANQNHPNLKTKYPFWADRIKQIAKIWKNLPNDKKQPYYQAAGENCTASRMNKQVRFFFSFKNATCCFKKNIFFPSLRILLVHE